MPSGDSPARRLSACHRRCAAANGYFFLAPVRAILFIASGGRLDFSAISRSCPMMKPRAGSSFSRPQPAGAKKPIYAPYFEHVPPDVTAGIFWLKNRDPARWRDAWQIDHNLGKYVISDKPMTEEQ
jgi:hypothetical protein